MEVTNDSIFRKGAKGPPKLVAPPFDSTWVKLLVGSSGEDSSVPLLLRVVKHYLLLPELVKCKELRAGFWPSIKM